MKAEEVAVALLVAAAIMAGVAVYLAFAAASGPHCMGDMDPQWIGWCE